VRELRNENIDVVNYSSNIEIFIKRALRPAEVSTLVMDPENRKVEVYLKPEEVSLAIGKGGANIKLASMLTEYTIDVFREIDDKQEEEDVYLEEFANEIDQWIIDQFIGVGLDTAKSVLAVPRDELIKKTDLEEETIDNVIEILRAEFEDD